MNGSIAPLLPHTRISPATRIRIERVLPAPGEILVRTGEQVGAQQKIARIPARGEIRVVDVAQILGLDTPNMSRVMVKRRGDQVKAGETLAARRGVIPLWHKPCRSPIAGRLTAIGRGWVVIEAESRTVDLLAFVSGEVIAISDQRSVTIETLGTHIVGTCGIGNEAAGFLQMPVKDPAHTLTAEDIELGFNNAILVGGATVSPEALERATQMKVRGIIVGSISASLFDLVPAPPFPIVATEGYGYVPMSSEVFDILRQAEGHEVSISGHMGEAQHSAPPGIIIPLRDSQKGGGDFSTNVSPTQLIQNSHHARTENLTN